MNIPLIDTHIWIWWLLNTPALSKKERNYLNKLLENGTPPFLSSISVWEMALLHKLGRIKSKSSFESLAKLMASPECVNILPINAEVAMRLYHLPNDFQKDPADRIIVATALAGGYQLITKDTLILKSGLVDIWQASF
jgi:PIN domain nuclease of toxin-antitoxin system